MGRKILQRKQPKSKIQEKQKEISNSIVVSQTIKEKLDKQSVSLRVKITSQEEKYKTITNEITNINQEKAEAKALYEKAKDKLIKINALLDDLGNQEKEKIENIELLEDEYNNKNKNLAINYGASSKSFNDTINKIENKLFKTKEDSKKCLEENTSLYKQNIGLKSDIEGNNLLLSDQKKKKQELETEITSLGKKNDIICEEVDVIIQVLEDVEKEKLFEENELSKTKEELSKTNSNLEIVKKELIKTRETNVKLVKKEENLNSRANHIKGVYKKAGLEINP